MAFRFVIILYASHFGVVFYTKIMFLKCDNTLLAFHYHIPHKNDETAPQTPNVSPKVRWFEGQKI